MFLHSKKQLRKRFKFPFLLHANETVKMCFPVLIQFNVMVKCYGSMLEAWHKLTFLSSTLNRCYTCWCLRIQKSIVVLSPPLFSTRFLLDEYWINSFKKIILKQIMRLFTNSWLNTYRQNTGFAYSISITSNIILRNIWCFRQIFSCAYFCELLNLYEKYDPWNNE